MSWTLQGLCHLRITLTLSEAILSKNEFKEFKFSLVKFTFVFTGVKSVSPESSEYFLDVLLVIFHVIGVDKDIVQIDQN